MLTDRLDELLKSIRAIQNTALIISFVSLAALVGLRGNLADRASRELDAVMAMMAIWDPHSEWLADWAQAEVGARHDPRQIAGFSIPYQDHGDYYPHTEFNFINPHFWVERLQSWSLHPLPEGLQRLDTLFPHESRGWPVPSSPLLEHPAVSPRLRAPQSLTEFADFWDALGRLTLTALNPAWSPDRGFRVWRGYADNDEGDLRYFMDVFPGGTDIRTKPVDHQSIGMALMNMGVVSEKLLYLTCDTYPGACGRNDGLSDQYILTLVVTDPLEIGSRSTAYEAAEVRAIVVLPVEADLLQASARGHFARTFGNKIAAVSDWDDADFSYAFPALAAYGLEQLGDFSLEELSRVIKSELDRGYTNIELMGAKIPISGLGYWVTAILFALVGTLLVLMIQLRDLTREADTDALAMVSTPWVGLFRTPTGPALAILACAGSPAAVAGFLVVYEVQAHSASWELLVFALPLVPAALLSAMLVGTWRHWHAHT
jgi:hypothetical protein